MDDVAAQRFGFELEWETFDWSCEVYAKTGRMMPEDGLEQLKIAVSFDVHHAWPGAASASWPTISAATRSAARPSVKAHCSATMRRRPAASRAGSSK